MATHPAAPALREALERALQEARAPGAAAYVGNRSETIFYEAMGHRALEPSALPTQKETLYDLASMTKAVATATAVMLLCEDGAIDLDQPVNEIVPIPAFRRFTVRRLLTHTSGLTVGRPLYKTASTLNEMLQVYAAMDLEYAPGSRRRYSDAGFMILGKVVELAAHDSLDAFCRKRIFDPLGMDHTTFNPPAAWAEQCAATERCPWRKKIMQGQVHDENAYAAGGVAGHAGLFSTAEDLARFCRAWMNGNIVKEKTYTEALRVGQVPVYPWQGLGWDLDPWRDTTMGYLPSRRAFGHVGWTGTSLWADAETGLFAILLSNTCHPSRAARDNETLRRVFYDAVAKAFYPGRSNAHTGLDRLVRDGFKPVRGKRIALLTNLAAVDQLGRPALDALRLDETVRLQRVFTPEHGLRGHAEAGETVLSEKGAVPIISLYGGKDRPTHSELQDLDAVLVDLPDIGARYYTYLATMRACLEACADAGAPVLVLDRPNPIGGAILEGPMPQRTDSPVCSAEVPVRHGMTLGELARFLEAGPLRGKGLTLDVMAVDGWPRALLFEACSLPWSAPSPNMPTPETALAYVGACLFEGTNLNEGRGTDTPFQLIGAPWLDAGGTIAEIAPEETAGCALEATVYTPRSIAGKAAKPRHRDKECRGIRLRVTDPSAFRPFTTALALIVAIRKRHAGDFAWQPLFDKLAGSDDLRRRIEAGETASSIVARYADALQAFDAARPKLYP
ncbi:MAG TPA: DUF1343 domain-containing protein [Candidatus Hydrogenedentes bacterium]|nr:DUF1343 domain-containing protein [Candidatus Hydrogenedentota bacterium]